MVKGAEFTYKYDSKLIYKYTGRKNARGVMYFDVYYTNFRGRMYTITTGMHEEVAKTDLSIG
jgi:hypothetical protein